MDTLGEFCAVIIRTKTVEKGSNTNSRRLEGEESKLQERPHHPNFLPPFVSEK